MRACRSIENLTISCPASMPMNPSWTSGGISADIPYLPLLAAQATAKDSRLALVVLPLRNLSDDPQQEYFSDGLTEELIAQIGRIDPSQLGVIARASAMKYKQGGKGISQIAKELDVNYALEGSVRRHGGACEFRSL